MYAALWNVLPGPWWVRALILLVLLVAVLFVLATWVFPFVDGLLNPQEATVGGISAGAAT
jgi:membrane protein implicated in regulation of membrane protease activity